MPTARTLTLANVWDIVPSTYNPRQADSTRLDLVALSLRKLGWLIPACCTVSGEILSGHQRHSVAVHQLGARQLPVWWVPDMPLARRKGLNILFNRATNDFAFKDSSGTVYAKLKEALAATAGPGGVWQLASRIPDKDPNAPESWPVLHRVTQIVPHEVLSKNTHKVNLYATKAASALLHAHVWSPILIGEHGSVVNGIGRLEALAQEGAETADAIVLTPDEAALASMLLNWLSMDFAIAERYADTLRFNSFRRARGIKQSLGMAFTFDLFKTHKRSGSDITFSPRDQATVSAWKAHYGTTVLDFGAGLLQDTERLKAAGVNCVPFEPYRLTPGTDQINPDLSRITVRAALKCIAEGTVFHSIFQNSVFNSVPFIQDRRHILRLIAALCSPSTSVHACAANTSSARYGYRVLNEGRSDMTTSTGFQVDYEPNTVISDLYLLPKVQKFHSAKEWYDLWSEAFQWVNVDNGPELVTCVCRQPRNVSPDELRAAIEFEFDLPYPDGTRLGLVDEALSAFEQRLGIQFSGKTAVTA